MPENKNQKRFAARILKTLRKRWPEASCSLDYSTPFQLLVATILSAQCTDVRVNLVTPTLFRKYDSAEKFARASLEDIEEAIRSTGFYHAKAKHIQGTARRILEHFDGEVPADLPSLLTLPGVGRKTANVVLGNAFGIVCGIVVDTHVTRLARRIGLSRAATPEKIELDLMRQFPQSDWVDLSHLFIRLGREFCQARKPCCEHCPLETPCRKIGVRMPQENRSKKKRKPFDETP